MGTAVKMRGPDDQGRVRIGEFAAVHHRLSIIGPDVRGHQPMTRDNVTVVFNGCIYNYREIRRELEADGVRFVSDTDTEVLPYLYRRDGTGMFAKLNGMFAIVLWDDRNEQLLAARDPFGEKPLYVCEQSGRSGFASSLASFEKGDWQLTPNLHAVEEILQLMAVSAPSTMYREVEQVPAGSYVRCSLTGSLKVQRYYKLPGPDTSSATSREEAEVVVGQRLDEAFLLRAVSDRPLGVFLSGGVDSSLVAESLARQLPQRLHTFAVRFTDGTQDYDETPYAAQVARYIGSEHQVLDVNADAEESLYDLAAAFDQPVANSTALPVYLISKAAKAHVDVALSGVGGDEIFGGYPRYLGLHWHLRMQCIPRSLRTLILAGLNVPGDSADSRNRPGRLRRFIEGLEVTPAAAYRAWVSLHANTWEAVFAQPEPAAPESGFLNSVNEYGELQGLLDHYGTVNGAMAYDILRYLPDDLLAVGDRMSMAHALELRAPFLDTRLLSEVLPLAASLKVAGPPWSEGLKLLLKAIARKRLPASVVDRPKQGFMAPVKHWLYGPLAGRVEALLRTKPLGGLVKKDFVASAWQQHQAGQNRADLLWALLLLDTWMSQRGWNFK